jgi:para-nitrobenzyl esterase
MRCKSVWIATCLACLQLAPSYSLAAESGQRPIVKTQTGLLEGTYLGSDLRAVAFLGVPYAAPPIGALRWKPPQPPRSWSGTRNADNFGSPCPQLPARWFPYIKGSEDCLYLNIWTPDIQANELRPVVLYLHGGSNTQGYGQMTPLGLPLSRMGLVVVSANYRLGPFGFFAHPALTAESQYHSSGNYGLLDQLQALRWIKENISEFGGDPGRVTVMGQSAGAVDICLLMASPLSASLFQRAILESGECQDTLNEDLRTPIQHNFINTTGEASGERLAMDLGIPEESGSSVLQRLRQIPTTEILKAWKNDAGLHFGAVVDGWVVPRQPARIFAGGTQMHVPIMVGSNADEATVFGHNDLKTVDDYKRHLEQDAGQYADEEFQIYPVNSDVDVPACAVRLESDEFASGAYSIARATTKAGVKSYLYYFTYVATGKRSRLGAHHGEELFFLSGSFPADWKRANHDKRLAELVRGYWAAFIKTGDPNFAGAPRWPPFDAKSQYLEIGASVGLRPVAQRIRTLEATMLRIAAGQE